VVNVLDLAIELELAEVEEDPQRDRKRRCAREKAQRSQDAASEDDPPQRANCCGSEAQVSDDPTQ
jgi:hypothetical protein